MLETYDRLRVALERPSGWVVLLLVGTVSIMLFGAPTVGSNESSYLLLSRILVDPEFLQFDWETSVRLAGSTTSALFDYLVAPLWFFTDDPGLVALGARILVMSAVLTALMMLLKSLRLPYLPAAMGICLWLIWGQSIAADEWLFGGAEKKVLAYALGLLAMKFILQSKYYQAGICGGLAAGAHLLVGGWICVVLAMATLFHDRRISAQLVRYCLTVLVVSSPFLVMSALFAFSDAQGLEKFAGLSTAELITMWRNPHHANPLKFLADGEWLEAISFFVAAFVTCSYVFEGRVRGFVQGCIAALALFWVLAIGAAYFDIYFILYLFPARVGDTLVPLLFAITFPQALLKGLGVILRDGKKFEPLMIVALALCVSLWMFKDSHHYTLRMMSTTYAGWQSRIANEPTHFDETVQWILQNTDPQDRFIGAVQTEWFKLYTGRPLIITMKGSPGNTGIHEWFCRLYRLNGSQPFTKLGFEMIKDVDQRVQALSIDEIKQIASEYSAKYFISNVVRDDLATYLVSARKSNYIYEIPIDVSGQDNRCLPNLRPGYQAIVETASVY